MMYNRKMKCHNMHDIYVGIYAGVDVGTMVINILL